MSEAPAESPRRGPLLDAGWLFLLAGIGALAATVLIPARNDLEEAQFYLQRALAVEQHRLSRLERYVGYLDALDKGDEGTILALAAMQLNQGPQSSELILPAGNVASSSASIFQALEPPPLVLPERTSERSALERWCLDDLPRLWLTAAGALCVLIGLLPPSTPSRPAQPTA